ncbi:MAG TPA: hypothetical protein VI893_01905 [Thermoplasmata archaeon]|nr:hypothetical protein [Thermoplasmata archaeon]
MGDKLSPKEIEAANKSAGNWALIAGILLLVAGLTGVALWTFIATTIKSNLPAALLPIADYLQYLVFLSSLGGIIVILGGLALRGNKVGTGKFFIALGAGFGLIGLILIAITSIFAISVPIASAPSLIGFLGLILSIIARMKVKKPEPV